MHVSNKAQGASQMIDIWFKDYLQDIYKQHTVAVFIDESGDAEFLLRAVKDEYIIQQANSELEELHVKYLIEKAQLSHKRFLIYTRSKKKELKFIREYCETCGCLEIRYLQNYIKDKLHQTLNLNTNLPKEDLISAAKYSVGKDRTYWTKLCYEGVIEAFDLNKELLPFVHDPDSYLKEKYDTQLRESFYREVNKLLGQKYQNKPPPTLANEVVKAMLDGLANGSCDKRLESVYKDWLDSISYRDSFKGYLDNHTLGSDLDIWNVSFHHPFRQVDELWLAEIGKSISDKATKLTTRLRRRNQSRQAQALGICFWSDVIALLEFDPKDIDHLSSFNDCVEFYKEHFCKLDTAIRNLYAEFLNKKELLEPFQELYKEHVSIFLDKWFKHWSDYEETQTGTLQRIIDNAGDLKTAVVVGDGVAYEIAELVATKVKDSVNLKKDSILADIPSETENNMSRIYMANGDTEAIQGNREKYLAVQNSGVSIDFIQLDEITEVAQSGQFLVCTYGDIDDMGENLPQGAALKYFPKTIDSFAEKISLLLASGYAQVYLIADHGFVLTGLLSDADKISVSPKGYSDKAEPYIAERYILTKKKQADLTPGLIEVKKSYKQFDYLYFAKNINPFKTPGSYGFAHGGVSPQELVTPYFCWERSGASAASLSVSIENQGDLKDVTGELFSQKSGG